MARINTHLGAARRNRFTTFEARRPAGSESAGYHYDATPSHPAPTRTPTVAPPPSEAATSPAGDYAGASHEYHQAVTALPGAARTVTERAAVAASPLAPLSSALGLHSLFGLTPSLAPGVPMPSVVPPALEKKTLGAPTLDEILHAAKEGSFTPTNGKMGTDTVLSSTPGGGGLGVNQAGLITTPSTRAAAVGLAGARQQLVRNAGPSLAGLSAAERRILPYAERAHKEYPDIPVSVLMAQDKQESGFNPLAKSEADAGGVSQFIPSTAESYGVEYGDSPKAIQSQVSGQAHLLHDDSFSSDPQGALSAYSGGYAAGDYNNPILEDAKASYSALDRPSKVPAGVRRDYSQAAQQARQLGIAAPTQRKALAAGAGPAPENVPYHAFNQHVARELHLVKSGQYDKGAGTLIVGDSEIGQGHEPEIAARLKLLSAKVGKPVYIISGHRTPEHSVEVGGFSDDPHTKGLAADIGVGAPTLASAAEIPESVYESVGLHRPFAAESSAEANHVQLLHGGSPSTGGGVGGGSFAGGVGVGGAVPATGGGGTGSVLGGQQAAQATPLTQLASPISAGPVLPGLAGAGGEEEGGTAELLAQLLAGGTLSSTSPRRRTLLGA